MDFIGAEDRAVWPGPHLSQRMERGMERKTEQGGWADILSLRRQQAPLGVIFGAFQCLFLTEKQPHSGTKLCGANKLVLTSRECQNPREEGLSEPSLPKPLPYMGGVQARRSGRGWRHLESPPFLLSSVRVTAHAHSRQGSRSPPPSRSLFVFSSLASPLKSEL